jgi:hypothetical protein
MASLQPAKMIRPGDSLVKYDNPSLISRTDKNSKEQRAGAAKKLPPVEVKDKNKAATQTEDILNSILPPR